MTITPSTSSRKLIEAKPVSIVDRLFPHYRNIAIASMLAVNLIYFLFGLARAFQHQPSSILSILSAAIVACFAVLVFQWIFYRLFAVLGGSDTSRSIVFLTIPALAIAIFSSYSANMVVSIFFPNPAVSSGLELLFIHYLLLAGWGAIYLALVQRALTRGAIEQARNLERLTRESEQRALRFQLNPHFVFNALNSVSSLVVDGENEKAEQLVDSLADYMRAVLKEENKDLVLLEEEVAQQLRYLEIERVRFPQRLLIETDISDEVLDWKIPSLIIQPLVENAIKHGVARSVEPVRIIISATPDAGRLKISVANDNPMESTGINNIASGTGTGLANIRERLATIYGPSAALINAKQEDGMAIASIVIPDETHIFGEY